MDNLDTGEKLPININAPPQPSPTFHQLLCHLPFCQLLLGMYFSPLHNGHHGTEEMLNHAFV